MTAQCELHPNAGRTRPGPGHPSGNCTECKAELQTARRFIESPSKLVKLVNGDGELAARLVARLDKRALGLVVTALRAAELAGRAAVARRRETKRRYDAGRPAAFIGEQIRGRIKYFGEKDALGFDAVGELRETEAAVREAQDAVVRRLRAVRPPLSENEIARKLGYKSRQAMHKRFPREPKVTPRPAPGEGAMGEPSDDPDTAQEPL